MSLKAYRIPKQKSNYFGLFDSDDNLIKQLGYLKEDDRIPSDDEYRVLYEVATFESGNGDGDGGETNLQFIYILSSGSLADAVVDLANGGLLVVDTNETIPSGTTITLPDGVIILGAGGVLTVASGGTLNVKGVLSDRQVFGFSNTGDNWKNAGTLTLTGNRLNPRWFGDGGTQGTDCATALMGMNAVARADNTKSWIFDFPKGYWTYSRNHWVKEIKDLTVYGNGSTFACYTNQTYNLDNRCLYFTDWLLHSSGSELDHATPYWGTFNHNTGMLIDAASIGDKSVTVSTPAEMANIQVGDHVLVGGFAQQFNTGYPPNLKYFEYKVVTAVDGGTGVVSFGEPLKYAYRTDWWEQSYTVNGTAGGTYGKARLYHLHWDGDTDRRQPNEKLRWYNSTFANNSLSSAPYVNITGVLDFEFVDCDMNNMSTDVGQTDRGLLKNCRIYNSESDKISREVTWDTCILGKEHDHANPRPIVSCPGCEHIIVRNCKSFGAFEINPRQVTLVDNEIKVQTDSNYAYNVSTGDYGTRIVSMRGNKIIQMNTSSYDDGMFDSGGNQTFDVDGVGASNEIQLDQDDIGDKFVALLDIGSYLRLEDGTNFGKVIAIYESGGSYIIENDAPNAWQVGDTIEVNKVQFFNDLGGNTVNNKIPLQRWHNHHGSWYVFEGNQVGWKSHAFYHHGRIIEIRIDVMSAYSGAATNPWLRILPKLAGDSKEHFKCDLSTAGSRVVRKEYQDILGVDSYTPGFAAQFGVWCNQLNLNFVDGSSALPVVNGEMPQIRTAIYIV